MNEYIKIFINFDTYSILQKTFLSNHFKNVG